MFKKVIYITVITIVVSFAIYVCIAWYSTDILMNTKEFDRYGFSLTYPDKYEIEYKGNGFYLVEPMGLKLTVNPEQIGFGIEFSTTENIEVNVNGKIISKLKVTEDDTGNVYYMITQRYPESYNKSVSILFHYEDIPEETINEFDQIIASIEFINDSHNLSFYKSEKSDLSFNYNETELGKAYDFTEYDYSQCAIDKNLPVETIKFTNSSFNIWVNNGCGGGGGGIDTTDLHNYALLTKDNEIVNVRTASMKSDLSYKSVHAELGFMLIQIDSSLQNLGFVQKDTNWLDENIRIIVESLHYTH